MKKTIFVVTVCISIVTVYAQDSKSPVASQTTPTQPIEMIVPPPPPPPPPAPPVPPAPPTAPEMVSAISSYDVVIINEQDNEISVRNVKGIPTVFVKKGGKTQKIKLSTWNANRKYYEKKYGQLPPPPPPPPAPAVEEVQFTPPVIKSDN